MEGLLKYRCGTRPFGLPDVMAMVEDAAQMPERFTVSAVK